MTTWKLPEKPILPDTFHVAAGDRELDREAAVSLIAELFTGGKHLESIRQVFLGGPCYDWNTMRLVWDGDQLIHHWGVIGYQMRLASINLKVAGVGAVGTLEEYRKRGVMTSAALSSLEAMHTNGYDLSILRGRHYVKFGYARAWNYLTVRLESKDLPILSSHGEYRPLSLVDQNRIDSLYNRFYSHFSGTAVRPIYHEILDEEVKVQGWEDSSGELTGYVRTDIDTEKNELTCQEATGDPERCLAVLKELLIESNCNSLAFFTLPYDHPILQLVRRGACLVEEQYFHNTGWRVRVVNLTSLRYWRSIMAACECFLKRKSVKIRCLRAGH
jgi:hypothetical protein